MTEAEFRAIAFELPGVEDSSAYGQPCLRAFGKFLTRLRAEDDSLALGEVDFDEREMLIEARPETFHTTPHYQGYRYVLARLETIEPDELRGFLLRRWRKIAPKAAVKALEAQKAGGESIR